eukprot:7872072-Pyramimonas_sp.AAC.1
MYPFAPRGQSKGWPGVSHEISLPLTTLKFMNYPPLHRSRAGGFQNVALALAPHSFVFKM